MANWDMVEMSSPLHSWTGMHPCVLHPALGLSPSQDPLWTQFPALPDAVGHGTHLHLLHDLLPKGAHLGGDGDGHVLCTAVLAADTIESPRPILDRAVQIRLER